GEEGGGIGCRRALPGGMIYRGRIPSPRCPPGLLSYRLALPQFSPSRRGQSPYSRPSCPRGGARSLRKAKNYLPPRGGESSRHRPLGRSETSGTGPSPIRLGGERFRPPGIEVCTD